MSFSFNKFESAGLRIAKKLGEERVSSVTSVKVDKSEARGHSSLLTTKKGGEAAGHALRPAKGRSKGRKG